MNPDSPIKIVEVNGSLKQEGEVNGFSKKIYTPRSLIALVYKLRLGMGF